MLFKTGRLVHRLHGCMSVMVYWELGQQTPAPDLHMCTGAGVLPFDMALWQWDSPKSCDAVQHMMTPLSHCSVRWVTQISAAGWQALLCESVLLLPTRLLS